MAPLIVSQDQPSGTACQASPKRCGEESALKERGFLGPDSVNEESEQRKLADLSGESNVPFIYFALIDLLRHDMLVKQKSVTHIVGGRAYKIEWCRADNYEDGMYFQ